MTGPGRHRIRLPCGEISYLEFPASPAGGGTTVLLLHGGGVDSAALSWGDVGPRLAAAGHRVITPDHPGYGASPLPDWPVIQQRLLAYVAQFIDALGLDRDGPARYVIGGLSLGGGLALGHVLARPDRVAGVILLDSYGLMPRLPGGRQLPSWLLQRSGVLNALSRWMATNQVALDWSMRSLIRDPARRTPELMAEIAAAARRPGIGAFEQFQRDEICFNRLRTDYTPRLASISCPTLIIHGDRDTAVPVSRSRASAALIPQATLTIVAGAGHWVQRDAPDAVIDAMVAFLAGLS